MKDLLRQGLLTAIALLILSRLYGGLIIPEALLGLLWAGLIITLLNRLVKPIIKLFLLPINLLTFGLFNWLANVMVLGFAQKIISDLNVTAFTTAAFNSAGFAVPSLTFSYFPSLILASLALSMVYNLLDKLLCG